MPSEEGVRPKSRGTPIATQIHPWRGFSAAGRTKLLEGLYCSSFVVLDLEDGVELGDLQQVVNVLAEVHQLEMPALVAQRGVAAHELADAGAVDVADGREIQQDVDVVLACQLANDVAQDAGAFAQSQFADNVHDDDAIYQARAGLKIHGTSLNY